MAITAINIKPSAESATHILINAGDIIYPPSMTKSNLHCQSLYQILSLFTYSRFNILKVAFLNTSVSSFLRKITFNSQQIR